MIGIQLQYNIILKFTHAEHINIHSLIVVLRGAQRIHTERTDIEEYGQMNKSNE